MVKVAGVVRSVDGRSGGDTDDAGECGRDGEGNRRWSPVLN